MFKIGSLLRVALLVGSATSSGVGVVVLTAPSGLADALGITEVDPLKFGTAFGVSFLMLVAFFVLRPRGGGVAYHHVHHHEPDAVRRPIPKNLRPKVGKKVRAKVRASAAQKVAAKSRRK